MKEKKILGVKEGNVECKAMPTDTAKQM